MIWNFIDSNGIKYERDYNVQKLSGKLLAASSISEEQLDELLNPQTDLRTSHAICVLKACARIKQAKDHNEKVIIAGDYDADGVCSTTILKATLDALKIQNGFYIPDRIKEGYGLKPSTVESAHEKGYSLIITVDNGVKAHDALKKAKELGIDTIVTDHHVIDEEVESDIVVHPMYMEEEYQFISGAGVALEISRNLIGEQDFLSALAGIAAMGDSMLMWRETRRYVLNAIDSLKHRTFPVLNALVPPVGEVNESTISFNICPKLNSVGRMSDMAKVNTLPKYLLLKNQDEITRYAQSLNQINELRKKRSEVESKKAKELVQDQPFIVVYDPSFHEGICGMIASGIVDQYHRPTLILSNNGEFLKGSMRSVAGFDLMEFFSDFNEFVAFGGHQMAAGITIRKADYESFVQHIEEKMSKMGFQYKEETETAINIEPNDINFDQIIDLQRLAPYPSDMVKPYFAIHNPEILERVETARMVKYRISNETGGFDAVLYTRKNIKALENPTYLIGRLDINRWKNKVTCQMILEDIQ